MTREDIQALREQISGRVAPKYKHVFGAESISIARRDRQARNSDCKAAKRKREAEAREARKAKTSVAVREARLIKRVLGFGLKIVPGKDW